MKDKKWVYFIGVLVIASVVGKWLIKKMKGKVGE